jgi:hypothetical protein
MQIKNTATGEISNFSEIFPNVGNPSTEWLAEQGYEFYVAPIVQPALAEMQAAVWEDIKQERDRRKSGGVLVSGKWFHTDSDSRIQHLGLTIMGASIPAGLQWKTMDGTFITMTQQLAGAIFMGVALADQHNFTNAEIHNATMKALPDPAGYDYSTGWLTIYEPVP